MFTPGCVTAWPLAFDSNSANVQMLHVATLEVVGELIPQLGLPIRVLTQFLKGSGELWPREVPPGAGTRFPPP